MFYQGDIVRHRIHPDWGNGKVLKRDNDGTCLVEYEKIPFRELRPGFKGRPTWWTIEENLERVQPDNFII